MCIIIYNEHGTAHDYRKLSQSYDNNPHGVGCMWIEEDGVRVVRGMLSKEELMHIADRLYGIPHVIHLRWRTVGPIGKEMTHPFQVSGRKSHVWMMHNGTFDFLRTTPGISDTAQFAELLREFTAEHGADSLFRDQVASKMERKIKSFNKVLFLDDEGKIRILNREQWHHEDGIWYSNTYSFIPGYREQQQKDRNKEASKSVVTAPKPRKRRRRKSRRGRKTIVRYIDGVKVELSG